MSPFEKRKPGRKRRKDKSDTHKLGERRKKKRRKARGGKKNHKKAKERLITKFGSKCSDCKRPKPFSHLSVDHITPLFLGGRGEDWNLQLLCIICKNEKDRIERQKQKNKTFIRK